MSKACAQARSAGILYSTRGEQPDEVLEKSKSMSKRLSDELLSAQNLSFANNSLRLLEELFRGSLQ